MTATMILCFDTGFDECWNCAGPKRAIDPDTNLPGPFEGDERFCCEECCVEAQERWLREERAWKLQIACCPECGFDNQEHDVGCSKP